MYSSQDLIADLKNILIGYLSPLNLKFSFSIEEISLHEIFMKTGAMPLFLYNKQEFIDHYLNEVNANQSECDVDFFAKIVFKKANSSYFGHLIEINHNLFENNQNINGSILYNEFLFALAENILSEKMFIINKNYISLDESYEKYSKFLSLAFNSNTNERECDEKISPISLLKTQ